MHGAAVKMSRAGGAGGDDKDLCLVPMNHLAGPLFVALSTQVAELVHQAGEMHIHKELQGRKVA